MKMMTKAGSVVAAFVAVTASANATVTTTANGTYHAFPTVNFVGSARQTVATNITWSSTNAERQGGSVFGYNEGYGFSSGLSDDVVAGLNSSSDEHGVADTMRFDFARAVSSVGGVLNWVTGGSPITIAIYDSADVLLESLTLADGSGDLVASNSFYGFQRSGADIASFRLTDGYVATIGGIFATGGTVPEPASWMMMIAGFGAAGGAMRRRRTGARLSTT